jgi:ABC-type dipeptide/oligopeptide/nickel transport system permease subunit
VKAGAGRMVDAAGAAVAAGVVLLSLVGAVMPEAQSVPDRRFSPPQLGVVRALLSDVEVDETSRPDGGLDPMLGSASVGPPPRPPLFTSRPSPVVRLGKPFRYAALSPHAVPGTFSVEGAPPGLTIGAGDGRLTGRPGMPGRFDVVVTAATADGHRVEQRFALFVEDRTLPLGADAHGRSVLRRLLESGRTMVPPALLAAAIAVLGGTWFGALAGFRGGGIDRGARLLSAFIQSMPPLLVVFLTAVASNMHFGAMMVAVGLLALPETADGVSLRVRQMRERDFVEAARELGLEDRTILWRELVWFNCRGFLLSRAIQAVVFAILITVTASYIGVVDPNAPQLGALLADGRTHFDSHPVLFAAPVAWLLIVIAALRRLARMVEYRWDRR